MDEQNVSEKPIESVADKLLKLEICDKTEENEENNFCLNENDEKDLCDTQVTDKNDEKYEKELDDIDCELCYSNKSRTDLFENITGHDVEIQCTNASNDALNNDNDNDNDEDEKKENLIYSECKKKEILICNENAKKEISTHNENENKDTLVCNGCGSDSKISTTSSENTDKGTSTNTEDESKKENASSSDNQISKEFFKIPSEALVTKIVRQAEFYFSNFNILKNNFLLKHVRRNKEGFVSLKLVASFRKIKSLTKDWRVVAHSLEYSKLLELNLEKTKIRRIEPIPKMEETSLGKTIIVFNLPPQNPTAEELEEMFSKFGAIVHAEIMTQKSENYNTYHKRCRYHNQEVATPTFGSLEFENFEDAMSAIKDVDSHLPKENKMKVVPLMSQVYKTKRQNPRFNPYGQYPRRGRFKQRFEYQGDQMGPIPLDESVYGRPPMGEKHYRRFYRGYNPTKIIHPPFSACEIPEKLVRDTYLSNGEDGRNGSFARSRQLKSSNRMNINKQFGSPHPRFADGTFGYRATHFEG